MLNVVLQDGSRTIVLGDVRENMANGVVFSRGTGIHRDRIFKFSLDEDALRGERLALPRLSPYAKSHGLPVLHESGQGVVSQGSASRSMYFVELGYVPGKNLDDVSYAGLNGQAPAYLTGIARRLQIVHDADIVHADVGLGNLLVSPDAIIDFGNAIVPGETTKYAKFVYASPEQLRGDPLDPRSDLFSLGATIYELETGRPIRDSLLAELDLPQEPLCFDRVRPELRDVVVRLLQPNPKDRYQSASQLEQALRRVA